MPAASPFPWRLQGGSVNLNLHIMATLAWDYQSNGRNAKLICGTQPVLSVRGFLGRQGQLTVYVQWSTTYETTRQSILAFLKDTTTAYFTLTPTDHPAAVGIKVKYNPEQNANEEYHGQYRIWRIPVIEVA